MDVVAAYGEFGIAALAQVAEQLKMIAESMTPEDHLDEARRLLQAGLDMVNQEAAPLKLAS